MHGGNRHVVKRCESCGCAARTTPRTGNTFSLTRLSGNNTTPTQAGSLDDSLQTIAKLESAADGGKGAIPSKEQNEGREKLQVWWGFLCEPGLQQRAQGGTTTC